MERSSSGGNSRGSSISNLYSNYQGVACHAASATSAGGASIDHRRCRDRRAVVWPAATVCTCSNSKHGRLLYVSGTGGPVESIVPSSSCMKTRISTGIFSRIVVGGCSRGQSRRHAEIQCAVLWASRGKRCTNGHIAPSNSSNKTRNSTEFPGRIFFSSGGTEGSRLNTEIQCVIEWLRHRKKIPMETSLVTNLRVRAGSDSSGIRGRTTVSNTPSSGTEAGRHLMAKNAAGWREERCVQVCPTCFSPEQKQLDPRASWVRAHPSGVFQVTWRVEGTIGEPEPPYPRPGWSHASRAPRSGGVQLSSTAELAQPEVRKGS